MSGKGYKCDKCGKEFDKSIVLASHVRTHSREEVECDWCGETIEKYKSELEGKENHFCGKGCHDKFQRRNRVVKYCSYCGKQIERPPSLEEKWEKTFCSRECHQSFRELDISVEELERLYWEEEMSTIEIAEILDASAGGVIKKMKDNDIPIRSSSKAQSIAVEKYGIKINLPDERIEFMYLKEKKPMHEIAEEFDVSVSTIQRTLEENNIDRRDYSSSKLRDLDLSETPNLFYIIGVILGDGCYYPSSRCQSWIIELQAMSKPFVKSFYNSLEKIGLNPHLDKKHREEIYNQGFIYRVQCASKHFGSFLDSLSLEEIKEKADSPQKKEALLRGLYESDGYLVKKESGKYTELNIGLDVGSCELSNMFKELLERLEFNPKKNVKTEGKERTDMHQVRLYRKEEVKQFLDKIEPRIKNSIEGLE